MIAIACIFCAAQFKTEEALRTHSVACQEHPLFMELEKVREQLKGMRSDEFNSKYHPKTIIPNWFTAEHVSNHLKREVGESEFAIIKESAEETMADWVSDLFYKFLDTEILRKK